MTSLAQLCAYWAATGPPETCCRAITAIIENRCRSSRPYFADRGPSKAYGPRKRNLAPAFCPGCQRLLWSRRERLRELASSRRVRQGESLTVSSTCLSLRSAESAWPQPPRGGQGPGAARPMARAGLGLATVAVGGWVPGSRFSAPLNPSPTAPSPSQAGLLSGQPIQPTRSRQPIPASNDAAPRPVAGAQPAAQGPGPSGRAGDSRACLEAWLKTKAEGASMARPPAARRASWHGPPWWPSPG